jgi:hypothetical protein
MDSGMEVPVAVEPALAATEGVGTACASTCSTGNAVHVPDFSQWPDTAGIRIDVQLYWDPAVPSSVPADEPICVVRLRTPESPSEFFEARLQRHHLQMHGAPELWTSSFERLKQAMVKPAGRLDAGDTVVLRREQGRFVIDVLFRGGRPGTEDRAVEILNAYSLGTSSRVEAVRLMRSVARAQRTHRENIAAAQTQLEAARGALADTEHRWTTECEKAARENRDLLRRFFLLLQAKRDKEQMLHATAQELRTQNRNDAAMETAADVSAMPPPLPETTVGRAQRRGERFASGPLVKRSRRDQADALDGAVGEPPSHPGAVAATPPPPPISLTCVTMPPTLSIFDPGSSGDEADLVAAAPKMRAPRPAVAKVAQTVGSRADALADSLFHSDGE